MVLTDRQCARLREALAGRLLAASYGAGVDSTAMLIALKDAGLRPDIITFADLRAEKPPNLDHLQRMGRILAGWSWPEITICRKNTLPGTGYSDLYGNCIVNQTLPSLAFGLKSCSIKWKQKPQDQAIMGARSGPNAAPPHPVWIEAQRRGERIVKLIGYDCGRADIRRSRNLPEAGADFDYAYPLQILGWDRADCVAVRSRDAILDSARSSSALPGTRSSARLTAFPAPAPRSVSAGASPGTNGRASTASSTRPSASGAAHGTAPASWRSPRTAVATTMRSMLGVADPAGQRKQGE